MQAPAPQKEHQWLQRLVGEWTFEAECSTGPDQPASKHSGRETVRSLGGLWTIGEGSNDGECPCDTIMTLGFDPQTNRFVGTFIARSNIELVAPILWKSLDEELKVQLIRRVDKEIGKSSAAKSQEAFRFVAVGTGTGLIGDNYSFPSATIRISVNDN